MNKMKNEAKDNVETAKEIKGISDEFLKRSNASKNNTSDPIMEDISVIVLFYQKDVAIKLLALVLSIFLAGIATYGLILNFRSANYDCAKSIFALAGCVISGICTLWSLGKYSIIRPEHFTNDDDENET